MIVDLKVMSVCNFDCAYCMNFNLGYSNIQSSWYSIIDKLVDSHKVDAINLTGGEPLLCDEIVEIVNYAKERGLKVIVSTNGSLLDIKRMKELSNVDIFNIGIDSFDVDICKESGFEPKGAKYITKEHFKAIIENCKDVKVTTVVHCDNKFDLSVSSVLKEENISEWVIQNCQYRGEDYYEGDIDHSGSYSNIYHCISDEDFFDYVNNNLTNINCDFRVKGGMCGFLFETKCKDMNIKISYGEEYLPCMIHKNGDVYIGGELKFNIITNDFDIGG